jgi:hypothetical protein
MGLRVTPAEGTRPHEILEQCTLNCRAAREAIHAEREILAARDADTSWNVVFWIIGSPPGEIRLALGGCLPSGRVSAGFRRRWALAAADACLDLARDLAEQMKL